MPRTFEVTYNPALETDRFDRFFYESTQFLKKQSSACFFGVLLLVAMLLTKNYYPLTGLVRYDFLFLLALSTQVFLLLSKMESWREAKVILIFHIIATVMELFKTSPEIGSWRYPETAFFRIAAVPLFTGFMYSAVGSYIARSWRLFKFEFTHYPAQKYCIALAALIYLNFFTHHYSYDMRWILFAASLLLFGRCSLYFTIAETKRKAPLLFLFSAIAIVIWLAENIATYAGIWLYPSQDKAWRMVSSDKILAWFLLMLISFVLVSFIHKSKEVSRA